MWHHLCNRFNSVTLCEFYTQVLPPPDSPDPPRPARGQSIEPHPLWTLCCRFGKSPEKEISRDHGISDPEFDSPLPVFLLYPWASRCNLVGIQPIQPRLRLGCIAALPRLYRKGTCGPVPGGRPDQSRSWPRRETVTTQHTPGFQQSPDADRQSPSLVHPVTGVDFIQQRSTRSSKHWQLQNTLKPYMSQCKYQRYSAAKSKLS
jgi:hypothetical protein